MDRYYALYEKLPKDGHRRLTVIKGKKAMRSTLKRYGNRTLNTISVLDTLSGLVVARSNE
jgi:hypothetical protein